MLALLGEKAARLSLNVTAWCSHISSDKTTATVNMQPALVVCSSKVHTLGKLLNQELAEHILGYAADHLESEAAPGALPNSCSKCQGPALVDMSDPRVRRAFHFCRRARRVLLEQNLARRRGLAKCDGR